VLRGDRDCDVHALSGRVFDVVVDTSAYHPRHIDLVAAVIAKPARYVLISTASVYSQFPATESTASEDPIRDPAARTGPANYAGLKRACEEATVAAFGTAAVLIRPGVLMGPFDPTNRFEYWVRRAAAGGEILAPGQPSRAIQLLDARDLAAWLVENAPGLEGVYNAAGPHEPLSMEGMLTACVRVASAAATISWVADAFLLERGITPWSELPLWMPEEAGPVLQIDPTRAWSAGLRCRPLENTIANLLQDAASNLMPLAGGMPKANPLSSVRESELLAEWHARLALGRPSAASTAY
jgi:2'-hydroxyisoflavone reductase